MNNVQKIDTVQIFGSAIEKIHSFDMNEDGIGFGLMLNLADKRTLMISVYPNEPIVLSVHDLGEGYKGANKSHG